MVLRAFAAHPAYRKSEAAITAGQLLKSRFFLPDSYTSYQAPGYWVRFDYPFWWNNLVAALDSLSLIGFGGDDPQIRSGLDWLIDHQEEDGTWKVTYAQEKVMESKSAARQQTKIWVTLAICRVLKRYLG